MSYSELSVEERVADSNRSCPRLQPAKDYLFDHMIPFDYQPGAAQQSRYLRRLLGLRGPAAYAGPLPGSSNDAKAVVG